MLMMAVLLLAQAATNDGAAKAEPVKEKKICRSNPDTGTRLGRSKTCRTRAEWLAIDSDVSRDVDRARATSRSN